MKGLMQQQNPHLRPPRSAKRRFTKYQEICLVKSKTAKTHRPGSQLAEAAAQQALHKSFQGAVAKVPFIQCCH
eukprot:697769-Pelagomonas_calceolata.AAC.2